MSFPRCNDAVTAYRISDGEPVWTVDVVGELGGRVPPWGYAESVLVDGDKLICTPGGEKTGTLAGTGAGDQQPHRMNENLISARPAGHRTGTVFEPPQNCVQHQVQSRAHVFSEKTQDEVTVLLQQRVLAAIATICVGV
jgi:hypothetical protein